MSEKNLLENILQNPLVKQYRRGALTQKIYLLQSEGGSGKTTALLSLYLYLVQLSLSDMSVVPLFVDVKKLTEFGEELTGSGQIGNMPRPIEKYIVKAYCGSDSDPKETMLEKVVHLFSPNNSPKFQKQYVYYLFLDGLNEVGFQAKQILWGEINSIAQADCVKIFVSSRTTDEPNLPDGIAKLSLLPLKEEDIHAYLEHNFGGECTEKTDTRKINPSLVHILQIPMYLKVFRETYNHKSPYPDIYEENIVRKADILDSYIQKLFKDNQEREYITDKVFIEFVVQYFLPAVAFQMVQNNASFVASDSDFRALRRNLQYFDSLAVPDEMLEAFQINRFAIQTACLNTGLLVFSDNQYTFAHQDWRDFFAAKHLINCMNADKLDDFEKSVDANIRRFTGELVREYSKTHKYFKAYDNKDDERKSECDFEQKEDLQAWGASPIEHFLQKHNLNSAQPLSAIATRNLIDIMKTSRNGKITSVYNGLDLRYVSFYNCNLKNATFDNTKIYPYNFIPTGHTGYINSVAFSPDGTKIVSGGNDCTVRVWDIKTRLQIGVPITGHASFVRSVAFSPDGKKIVSSSDDATIRIWDAETGAQIGTPLTGHTSSVESVAFSPDGTKIVSGSMDKTIRIWDTETGRQIGEPLTGHASGVRSVAFSSNGTKIVSGSWDKTMRIWDSETGFPTVPPLTGHADGVQSVVFSPDGTKIASSSGDGTICIWDSETGFPTVPPLTGHADGVQSVVFSPDSTKIVSSGWDGTIRVWDADTGLQIGNSLTGHTSRVCSVAFSPDGKKIVSGSLDETIRIWDVETGRQIGDPITGPTVAVCSICFPSIGRKFAVQCGDNTIRIWDAETGRPFGEPLEHTAVYSVAFSHDGKKIASGGDNTIRIWDAETGRQIGQPFTGHTDVVKYIAFSLNDKKIVSGSMDKTIRIWDAETGRRIGDPIIGHTAWVEFVAFSSGDKKIVSSSDDATIRIWDAETGLQIGEPLTGHTGWVESVAVSSGDKKIVSGSNDDTIRIWDAETGLQIGEPLTGHDFGVESVAFSPDGKKIVSGSWDKTIRIWDAETGRQIGEPLTGHASGVRSVAFSSNGTKIISGSWDKTMRIWDLKKHLCSIIQIIPTCVWNCDFKNAQYNGDDPSEFYKIIYDNGGDVKQEYIPKPIPFEYNENQFVIET